MSELKKKQKELDKVRKSYDAAIRQAKREKKSHDEIEELIQELWGDVQVAEEEVKIAMSREWVRKAEKMFLPVPSRNEKGMWEQSIFPNTSYLTPAGITKLRNLIREETTARRKAVLELVTPLTGIIGVTTGLIAVILTTT
jgi:hypothetical protein